MTYLIDAFLNNRSPIDTAKSLSQPKSPYKLKQIGFTLALEYLRNVGIDAIKPDVHVRRILGVERLGYASGHPTEIEAVTIVQDLAKETDRNVTYLDNLLWIFCAIDYGNICGAQPRCGVCQMTKWCNYPLANKPA